MTAVDELGPWDPGAEPEPDCPEAFPVSHPYPPVPGNADDTARIPFPGNTRETPETWEAPRYADVAAILDGATFEPPAPTFGPCSDGVGLFYAGQVNGLVGFPESGKTFVAIATAVAALAQGSRVGIVDLDHMGAVASVGRALALDGPEDALRELDRFRYAEPVDGAELVAVARDLAEWRADLVIVDSVGELLPMFGASSNSPDDFTRVHARILKPMAAAGACVVTVDHLAKSPESRAMGATGTDAKRRAIGGTLDPGHHHRSIHAGARRQDGVDHREGSPRWPPRPPARGGQRTPGGHIHPVAG